MDDRAPIDVRAETEAAETRIRGYLYETPLEPWPRLSAEAGAKVLLKLENFQVTRSFKARGAFNALLSLSEEGRARGVVTASSGNHAMAMAHAMMTLGIEGEIWLSEHASPAKIEGLRARGATLRLIDGDPEAPARAEADRTGRIYVSPYNNARVMGGQGTIAIELLRQTDRLDAVFVPVGGGGLISGIAGHLKAVAPRVWVIGCEPAVSPVMSTSIRLGEISDVPWDRSISDATIGPIEPGSITFPICRDNVDEWVAVSEEEIAAALRMELAEHWVMVEGAAALSVAGFLQTAERYRGQTVVCVLSGARISMDVLAQVLGEH